MLNHLKTRVCFGISRKLAFALPLGLGFGRFFDLRLNFLMKSTVEVASNWEKCDELASKLLPITMKVEGKIGMEKLSREELKMMQESIDPK